MTPNVASSRAERIYVVPEGAPIHTCATARLRLRSVAAVEVLATDRSAKQDKRIYPQMRLQIRSLTLEPKGFGIASL